MGTGEESCNHSPAMGAPFARVVTFGPMYAPADVYTELREDVHQKAVFLSKAENALPLDDEATYVPTP